MVRSRPLYCWQFDPGFPCDTYFAPPGGQVEQLIHGVPMVVDFSCLQFLIPRSATCARHSVPLWRSYDGRSYDRQKTISELSLSPIAFLPFFSALKWRLRNATSLELLKPWFWDCGRASLYCSHESHRGGIYHDYGWVAAMAVCMEKWMQLDRKSFQRKFI